MKTEAEYHSDIARAELDVEEARRALFEAKQRRSAAYRAKRMAKEGVFPLSPDD